MTTIVVSGALANKPLNGGEAWVRMSWVRGLQRLGVQTCFVEQISSAACTDGSGNPAPFEESVNRAYFDAVTAALAPDCPVALLCEDRPGVTAGDPERVVEMAGDADLLVNISGHLTVEPLRGAPRAAAYVDLDPAFTQIWHASGDPNGRLAEHDWYFTVGENIGLPSCSIPTSGIDWRPLPPPVTIADWPLTDAPRTDRFTTVANWRSPLGQLSHDGAVFSGKHHQWRRMIDLPERSRHEFEIALAIHPAESADRDDLLDHGWHLREPAVAADPFAFRDYVKGSGAEFSVAHGAYVETRSGWLSDRTVRYLAAGRPALVQDTGAAVRYPIGTGLVTFSDVNEAAAAADRIVCDYAEHAAAARALACEHFDSDVVLAHFLEEIGLG